MFFQISVGVRVYGIDRAITQHFHIHIVLKVVDFAGCTAHKLTGGAVGVTMRN